MEQHKTNSQTSSDRKKPPKKQASPIVLLCVILLLESVITCVWFPGFLTRPAANGSSIEKPETSWFSGSSLPATNTSASTEDSTLQADDYFSGLLCDAPARTEEITLRYTEEEIQAAPVRTATVSIEEPVADLGNIKVDFKSWNLEQDTDELLVRELQEHTEGEEGWTIKAYDFALASGQRTFDTDIEIVIPREESDGDYVSCVGFDETSGQWEDLYLNP